MLQGFTTSFGLCSHFFQVYIFFFKEKKLRKKKFTVDRFSKYHIDTNIEAGILTDAKKCFCF